MAQWKKPKPPYAVEVPPRFADTPYDDLPAEVQERLDVVRIDTDAVIPEPQPDVMDPVPEPQMSPHMALREADAAKREKHTEKASKADVDKVNEANATPLRGRSAKDDKDEKAKS